MAACPRCSSPPAFRLSRAPGPRRSHPPPCAVPVGAGRGTAQVSFSFGQGTAAPLRSLERMGSLRTVVGSAVSCRAVSCTARRPFGHGHTRLGAMQPCYEDSGKRSLEPRKWQLVCISVSPDSSARSIWAPWKRQWRRLETKNTSKALNEWLWVKTLGQPSE